MAASEDPGCGDLVCEGSGFWSSSSTACSERCSCDCCDIFEVVYPVENLTTCSSPSPVMDQTQLSSPATSSRSSYYGVLNGAVRSRRGVFVVFDYFTTSVQLPLKGCNLGPPAIPAELSESSSHAKRLFVYVCTGN